jgi:hypothetical protein|tara:strand:+ start:535 stop:903 length:369 start_codon:yes stop_codon:yes gene_type:complete
MKTQIEKIEEKYALNINGVKSFNDHLVFTRKIKKIEYLAMNMFGWIRNPSLDKCVEEMKTNHYGRAKWSDEEKREETFKDVPYRIFMLLDTDSDYSVSSAVESLGFSENGIPTVLIADTYKD